MKKSWLLLLLVIPVGILSYSYTLVGFLLLLVAALALLIVLVGGAARVFSRKNSIGWLRVPLIITVVCVLGIITSLLRPLEPATIRSSNVSESLAYAYKMDQADRMTLKPYLGFRDAIATRDSARLELVQGLHNNHRITEPLDKFYAAFIFHHSKESSLYKIAHELAREAAAVEDLKDVYQVQWLAKATYDRWMVSLGKPQKYGTQESFSISVD